MKAAELLKECLSIFENSLPETHPSIVTVLKELSNIAFIQEWYEESLQMYGKLRNIFIRTPSESESEEMATVCHNMGMCYAKLSNLNAAEEAFSESLRIKTSIFPRGHRRIFDTEQALQQVRQLKSEQ